MFNKDKENNDDYKRAFVKIHSEPSRYILVKPVEETEYREVFGE